MKPITHKKFRQSLEGTTVHEKIPTSGGLQKAKQGIPSSGPPEEMLNGEPHFIERNETQPTACDVCKANKLAKRNNILQDFVPVVTWCAIYTVELCYNDIGLCDTSSIASNIPWYQLTPHKARVFLPCLI
jgi:hypothetical protein